MPYIWEDYSEGQEYRLGGEICPYIEVLPQKPPADSDDPLIRKEPPVVNVNPLIRFSKLFNASFQDSSGDVFAFDALTENVGEDGVKGITDVLFHYLAQLDRTKGLDSGQRAIEKLRNEVELGLWGRKAKELLGDMSENDRECILYVLSRRFLVDRQSFFMEAVGKTFPFSSLCFEEKTELYYLYVGSEETEYNVKKLDLIKTLFWTINWNLTVVWKRHYGIVGCDDAMRIGNIQIV